MDALQPIPEEKVDMSVTATGGEQKKKIKFNFDDDLTKKEDGSKAANTVSEEAMIIATILQYFVTPPYLAKTIFKSKFFPNFQYAKNLPKLSTLPFMSKNVSSKYREGLTVPMGKISKPLTKSNKSQPLKNTKYVNIGYDSYLELKGQQVPTNVRVTVNVEENKVVSPLEAYQEQTGAKASYGYHVRIASSFSSIFTECAFKQGYDHSIFVNGGDYFHKDKKALPAFELKNQKQGKGNLLILCCNYNDLMFAFEKDKTNLGGVEGVQEFLDSQCEVPSGVRVEDAVMIALTKVECTK